MITWTGLFSTYESIFRSAVWPTAGVYIVYLAPIGAAILLGILFWEVWVRYVRLKFFLSLEYTVLELRLPRDLYKSPLAMETVLTAIHNTADGTSYGRFWVGEVRPWYSLEIVSIEGKVKFYIWTETRRKSNLKSALYSQYPGLEIVESNDYSKDVQWDPKVWKIWASEFEFTKRTKEKKPIHAYPIKTYIDFGMDKDPKEEYKVDPLTHILEWMGSLRPNEQAWFQFLCQAHIDNQRKPDTLWSKKHDEFRASVDKTINDIMIRDPKTKTTKFEDPDAAQSFNQPRLTRGETDIINAIERKAAKPVFDVIPRTLYIAQRSIFDTPFGIGGCISSMKQFNHEHMNGFKPGGKMMPGGFDYPWQDYANVRRNYYSKRVLQAYRRRSGFYPPFKAKHIILNTEELATMFHLPGAVATTPTLTRIPSKRVEAPSNLPT
jgi:hypothetical protein